VGKAEEKILGGQGGELLNPRIYDSRGRIISYGFGGVGVWGGGGGGGCLFFFFVGKGGE